MCNIPTCISRNHVVYYLQEVRYMKIFTQHPVLVGKGSWGIYRVTANGHSRDYYAFTTTEAKRRYLMEFGRVHGEIFVEKVLDKSPNLCYNHYIK